MALVAAFAVGAGVSSGAEAAGWVLQRSLVVPGAFKSVLAAVSCHGTGFCMAVGQRNGSSFSATRLFAERWNGRRWSILAVPDPSTGAGGASVSGVSCASATFCVAAATDGDQDALLDTWNGIRWTVAKSPTLHAYASMNGVSCTSAVACTAVGAINSGRAVIERWNGRSWSLQKPASLPGSYAALFAVSCPTIRWCMAAGVQGTSPPTPISERWDGSRWSLEPVPRPMLPDSLGIGYLTGISCRTPTMCEAVGTSGSLVNPSLADRWNGTSWSEQSTPLPNTYLRIENFAQSEDTDAVSCVAVWKCVAVPEPLTLTGSTWIGAPYQAPPVVSVSCVSTRLCIGVGGTDNGRKPIIERYT